MSDDTILRNDRSNVSKRKKITMSYMSEDIVDGGTSSKKEYGRPLLF